MYIMTDQPKKYTCFADAPKLTKSDLFKKLNEHGPISKRSSDLPYPQDPQEAMERYYYNFKRISRDCFGHEQNDNDIDTNIFTSTKRLGRFLTGTMIYDEHDKLEIADAIHKIMEADDAHEELLDYYERLIDHFLAM